MSRINKGLNLKSFKQYIMNSSVEDRYTSYTFSDEEVYRLVLMAENNVIKEELRGDGE